MKNLLSFTMAFAHIRTAFGKVLVTVMAVGIGVALVVATQLMNGAVMNSFLESADAVAGRAALTITGGQGFTFDEAVLDRVQRIPGIALAVPLVTSFAFSDDQRGELLSVYGVDITDDAAVRVYHRNTSNLVDDTIAFLNQRDSIILGREYATRRHLTIGSQLALVTPTGIKVFTVRGLLDPEGLARTLGGRLVVMDIQAAELAYTAPGQINQIDLVVAPEQLDRVKSDVAAVLPDGLQVEEPLLRKAVVRKTIGSFQAMVTLIAFLTVGAGFILSYGRLSALFEARTWETGLLRALGARRSAVFFEMLKESLLLGIIGTMIGLPLGVVLGRVALPVVAGATALQSRQPQPHVDPRMTIATALVGLGVGLGSSVLAAVVPAFRISRRQPIAALRMLGREMPVASIRVSIGFAAVLLLATAALLQSQASSGRVALGNVTTALLALATCVAARPVVALGGAALARIWAHVFPATAGFAATHLSRQARRVSRPIATVGIGVGIVLMTCLLAESLEKTVLSQFNRRIRADFVVTSAYVSDGYLHAPYTDRVAAEIATIQGVEDAVGQEMRDIAYRGQVAVLDGYDAACFRNERVCGWPLDDHAMPGALETVARGTDVMVSSSFARQFGTRAGDVLTLDSPTGPQHFLVAAITSGQAVSAVVMNRALLRDHWNDLAVRWTHVSVAPGGQRSFVESTIKASLAERYRLQVFSGADMIAYFTGQVREAFRALFAMESLILILVLIGVSDTMAMEALLRQREFGVIRAIGVRRRRLVQILLLDGATLGVLGLFLATSAGAVLGLFWVRVQFPALLGWAIDLHVPYAFVAGVGLLTMILCIAGAVVPSMRTARLPVPTALRQE